MQIILSENDIKTMPEALRSALLKYMEKNLSDFQFQKEDRQRPEIEDSAKPQKQDFLEFTRPDIIPIELACSIISGLNENSRTLLDALIEDVKPGEENQGLSRTDILDRTGIKVSSLNGTIGSINRRLIHRFYRQIYDLSGERTNSNLISLGHDGRYHFKAQKSKLNFQIASIISKSPVFFDQADIELVFKDKLNNPKSVNLDGAFDDDDASLKIKLSSDAYFAFDRGEGAVDFYKRIPELKISKEAALFSGNRKKLWAMREAGMSIHACCDYPCHSFEWAEGNASLIQIGPAQSQPNSNKFEAVIKTHETALKNNPLKTISIRPIY